MNVHLVKRSDWDEWARLRAALWPDCPAKEHEQEMGEILQNLEREVVFVSVGPDVGTGDAKGVREGLEAAVVAGQEVDEVQSTGLVGSQGVRETEVGPGELA